MAGGAGHGRIAGVSPKFRNAFADGNRLTAAPPLRRRTGGRVVAGVAGGIADHLGVPVFRVRLVFAVLGAASGMGVAAYGLLWMLMPPGDDVTAVSATDRRRATGLLLLSFAALVILMSTVSGSTSSLIFPVVLAAVGLAVVWREFDTQGPSSAVLGASGRPSMLTWVRVIAGATLVFGGIAVVVLRNVDLSSLRDSLVAIAAALVGAVLLTVPLWLRLWRALGAERAARIRTEERDEIASHLHDSVLQTLALIQKRTDNPGEVLRLARSQERELRSWLFSSGDSSDSSLAQELRAVAGEVEDAHTVVVSSVIVGDADLSLEPETGRALVGATREALVNAAKHSGQSDINLYAEVEPGQISVFIRDRGKGFDPEAVSPDRQGIVRSIKARVMRRGGQVQVKSEIGKGTEVGITLPYRPLDADEKEA
ncbi:ATP-binding protein [Mycobacteroides sp. LB1]|uniref:PspC domain-containing protein n=1 Tax=Mycobacteroides sp. LB1 TaxID=2750814 RepID=UPI0015DF1B63|nr:PspC domain-containing protein [Mycobacteroides sp. LB1]